MEESLNRISSTDFAGRWIDGGPWDRFGLYNSYVVTRDDGRVLKMPAHAGELVPGSTEDLIAALAEHRARKSRAPMTLELDPTYACASVDCGGACFSAAYRALAPRAQIDRALLFEIIETFAANGGRILRLDGGGDPLLHLAVRSGDVVSRAADYGLKTTILTSGDLLDRSALSTFASSGCYVRVSLNAATDATRRAIHGNAISLSRIMRHVEGLARELVMRGSSVPVGATFLVTRSNYAEVLQCALMARAAGVRHFSVRRVLGPDCLRPQLSASERAQLEDLLEQVRALHGDQFRVAVPWRPIDEPDLNPSRGDVHAHQCWQSTLKTVIEPNGDGRARAQLCGRYRGGGVGQLFSLPQLFTCSTGDEWTEKWQRTFEHYPISRAGLLNTCLSCIDRGFIQMVDRLFSFSAGAATWSIRHLESPNPWEIIER